MKESKGSEAYSILGFMVPTPSVGARVEGAKGSKVGKGEQRGEGEQRGVKGAKGGKGSEGGKRE